MLKMTYTYRTKGVCSRAIIVDVEDGIVKRAEFVGGCSGNTQGVAALAEGRPAAEVIRLVEGIDYGGKGTSCPDQLSRALKMALADQKEGA